MNFMGELFTSEEIEKGRKQLEIELEARGVKSLDELSWIGQAEVATEVMLKSGVGPKALKGFDAVKAVREGWG